MKKVNDVNYWDSDQDGYLFHRYIEAILVSFKFCVINIVLLTHNKNKR